MPRLDKALAFAADGNTLEVSGDPAPAIVFEATPTPVIHFQAEEPKTVPPENDKTPTAEELADRAKKLQDQETAFAARQDEARKASNGAIVDGLVSAGKVLPATADRLKTVFNALADEPLEFAAGEAKKSPAAELAALLGGAIKLVPVDEGKTSPGGTFDAKDVAADPDKITAAAKALQKDNPSLSFEAAVERVSTQQEG
jgi:hypothetical protein